jgi:hypothetical protein
MAGFGAARYGRYGSARRALVTWWMWYGAGIATVVAALMLAALVSRWFREPATHRAGIDEDEDDLVRAEVLKDRISGFSVHLDPSVTIQPGETKTFVVPANLWPRGVQSTGTTDLGPPPTYPETPDPPRPTESTT